MENIMKSIMQTKIVESIIVVIISFLLYRIINKVTKVSDKNKKIRGKLNNKKITYIKLFSNAIKYAFIIITILILLQINGVNVTSMLAGVGIVGAIIGLALQDALKDIIMGANIVTDDFFAIGDTIKYKGIEGKVIGFGLKTTKLQDIATSNIITIANRNIVEAEKVSDYMYIDIPAPYEVPKTQIDEAAVKIVNKIKQGEHVEDCKYLGLSGFESSNLIYKLAITRKPEYKYQVQRLAIQAIKEELDVKDISIPYTQIQIHTNS